MSTLFANTPLQAEQPGKLPLPAVLDFMLAGNATFTVKSLKSGIRFTYRVRQGDRGVHFVNLMNGSNYSYLGIIRDGEFSTTKRSTLAPNSQPIVLFRWLFNGLQRKIELHNVEVWHEGRCGMCGRALTVPESILTGFGPDCAAKRGGHA